MKIKYRYIAISFILFVWVCTGCTKLDDYPAPDSGIHGALTDAETGELITLPVGAGSIRLLEQDPKYPNPNPIDLPVNAGSGYQNSLLFAAQYKVFPLALSGPFVYPSLDTVSVTLKPGTMAEVNFKVIPYYRIAATVSDSTFTYTVTSSKANTATGAHLTDVYFMISADSSLTMSTAGNLPGTYYPNRFPLSGTSDAILGVQQTFTIPFGSTRLPKGNYYFRVSCAGSNSDGQYNYSPVIAATVH